MSLQKTEVGALGDWLLGTRPTSSTPIGYQSSKNPQDWLMSHKESKVRATSSEVLMISWRLLMMMIN